MKFSQILAATVLCTSTSVAIAQTTIRDIEFGVKAGGTFTHGYTTIPSQTASSIQGNIQVPALDNKNNGIGYGYSGGIWARKNFRSFFIQAEVTYNRFVLKQKTLTTVDVNASASLANALPVTVQPGLLNATLNVTSESILEAVDVPILIGKRWMGGKLRGYGGPNLIFVRKAQADRITSGAINANTSINFPKTTIPATGSSTNLLNKYEAQGLEVKDFTYAIEVGVGYTPLPFLDVDLRYAVPVGGVYKDANVKGFLGIATVSVGYKIF